MVIFPEKFQVACAEPNLDPQRAWLGLCGEFGLSCVDLWPAFAAAAEESGSQLFTDIQHPNAAGLAVAARAVTDFLMH